MEVHLTLKRGSSLLILSLRVSGMLRLCGTITQVDSGSLLRYTLMRSVRLLEDTFHTICLRSRELSVSGVRRGITTCSIGVVVVVVVVVVVYLFILFYFFRLVFFSSFVCLSLC